jgi:DNA-binding winged helix-turn-helix (wHTH) protein
MRVVFDRFVLDRTARQLTSAGEDIHLSPKAFDLLALLVENRPRVVDKAAIRATLWPGIHVVDASLTNLVTEIRQALDQGREPSWLRTVHGVGYAFNGEATDAPIQAEGRRPRPLCRIRVRGEEVELGPGEHVIGRHRASAVFIDSNTVSRRHAMLRVPEEQTGASATVEDLGSTNGTYLGGRRVTGTRPVANGDRIRVGSITLVYRDGPRVDAPTRRVRPARRAAGEADDEPDRGRGI